MKYIKFFKDKLVGKYVLLYDKKDHVREADAIHVLDIDDKNRYVYFMQEGGVREWDTLRGDYTIKRENDVLTMDVREANWHWIVNLNIKTGQYIAIE